MKPRTFIQKHMSEKHDFKPDFDLLDRYISYSSELLRISLLGIGAYGSLAIYAVENPGSSTHIIPVLKSPSSVLAVVLLLLTSALCLLHRYVATNSMTNLVKKIRGRESGKTKADSDTDKALRFNFSVSSYSLILSAITFGFGLVVFFVSTLSLLGNGCG